MKTQHTPGPWRQVDARNPFDQVERVVVKGTSIIATLGNRHMEAERDANSFLIAAAPDLLAALEECSEYFAAIDAMQPIKKHGCVGDRVRQISTAAIAKAKGQP